MKTNYTLLILFFIALGSFAQDKKLSIEVSYPLSLNDANQDLKGIIDASIKYRFAERGAFKYGASFTFDYLKDDYSPSTYNFEDRDYYFYHINGFVEATIPTVEKFHPFAGLGFTVQNFDTLALMDSNDIPSTFEIENNTSLGFNFQFGLQYDITNSFYAQSYFQFIRTYEESDYSDSSFKQNYNLIKFGLGYKF